MLQHRAKAPQIIIHSQRDTPWPAWDPCTGQRGSSPGTSSGPWTGTQRWGRDEIPASGRQGDWDTHKHTQRFSSNCSRLPWHAFLHWSSDNPVWEWCIMAVFQILLIWKLLTILRSCNLTGYTLISSTQSGHTVQRWDASAPEADTLPSQRCWEHPPPHSPGGSSSWPQPALWSCVCPYTPPHRYLEKSYPYRCRSGQTKPRNTGTTTLYSHEFVDWKRIMHSAESLLSFST